MWVLQLNDMRAVNAENTTLLAHAETVEAIIAWLVGMQVESYVDGKWSKYFRPGSPLEWYIPPHAGDNSVVEVGDADEWAANAREEFNNRFMKLTDIDKPAIAIVN